MMNGLLVESIVEAIVHCHAELVQTILVGSDIHLCATWQTGLDAAVLIETEQFANVAVLAVRPALVLLVEYEVRLLAVGVGYLVTILQSLDSIHATVLAHHVLGGSHLSDHLLACPELDGVEHEEVGYRAYSIGWRDEDKDKLIDKLVVCSSLVPAEN